MKLGPVIENNINKSKKDNMKKSYIKIVYLIFGWFSF